MKYVRTVGGGVALLNVLAAALAAQTLIPAVWVMRIDGSEARKLVAVDGCNDHGAPRWSHDGSRLVFNARVDARSERASYVVNADGTGLRKLCVGRVPDWSPDDKQIAFQANAAPQIFVQNLDGDGRNEIVRGDSPRWSPDGARLAFSDRRVLKTTDLLTGETNALFDNPASYVFDGFAWSADGARLAVVVRPQPQALRQLLLVEWKADQVNIQHRQWGQMGGFVSFSPDGKQVVFSDAWKIRIADVDGDAKPRVIPGQRGKSRAPAWSPDGEWIAFVSDRKDP